MSSQSLAKWTKLIGAPGDQYATAISTAANGFIYVAGDTYSSLDGQIYSGESDAFISKYGSDGTKVWTKQLGSSSDEKALSISTATDGSVYISGSTNGSLDGQKNSGGSDGFISKFNSDGIKLWTKLLGSSGTDWAKSVNANVDGSIYITGNTSAPQGGQAPNNAFISKYSSDGLKIWTKLLQISEKDTAYSISTSADGMIYVVGTTKGTTYQNSFQGTTIPDGFISKYGSDGSEIWTKVLGTSLNAKSVSTAGDGSIYITGNTTGSLDNQNINGGSDIFISKYSSDGTKVWAKLEGGLSYDYAESISIDSDGWIYIAGWTHSSLDGNKNSGGQDAFISKYSSDGTKMWTKQLGTSESDKAFSISTAADGSVYISGITSGSLDGQKNSGSYDGFISKFIPGPTFGLYTSSTSVNEGSTFSTTVITSNVPDGTTLYWTLDGEGIDSADLNAGELTGAGVINNGKFQFSHTIALDQKKEANEQLNIKLYADSSKLQKIASASIAIIDIWKTPQQATSQSPSPQPPVIPPVDTKLSDTPYKGLNAAEIVDKFLDDLKKYADTHGGSYSLGLNFSWKDINLGLASGSILKTIEWSKINATSSLQTL